MIQFSFFVNKRAVSPRATTTDCSINKKRQTCLQAILSLQLMLWTSKLWNIFFLYFNMGMTSLLERMESMSQTDWENEFGGWKAEGDDLWLLPFFDETYGTDWSAGQPERVWQHGKNTGWSYVVWDGTLKSDSEQGDLNPGRYELRPNYPNLFNPVTHIGIHILQTGPVHLVVYDLVGREVSTLLNGVEEAGEYTLAWEAVNREGTQLSSGIYLCRLLAGSRQKTLKMMALR